MGGQKSQGICSREDPTAIGLGGRIKFDRALVGGREGVGKKAPLLAKNARNGAPGMQRSLKVGSPAPTGLEFGFIAVETFRLLLLFIKQS
jgi:hypothetical protein